MSNRDTMSSCTSVGRFGTTSNRGSMSSCGPMSKLNTSSIGAP